MHFKWSRWVHWSCNPVMCEVYKSHQYIVVLAERENKKKTGPIRRRQGALESGPSVSLRPLSKHVRARAHA